MPSADLAVRPDPAENPDGAVGLGGRRRLAGDARIRDRFPPGLGFGGRLTRGGRGAALAFVAR